MCAVAKNKVLRADLAIGGAKKSTGINRATTRSVCQGERVAQLNAKVRSRLQSSINYRGSIAQA
jgi:hypothetical protein